MEAHSWPFSNPLPGVGLASSKRGRRGKKKSGSSKAPDKVLLGSEGESAELSIEVELEPSPEEASSKVTLFVEGEDEDVEADSLELSIADSLSEELGIEELSLDTGEFPSLSKVQLELGEPDDTELVELTLQDQEPNAEIRAAVEEAGGLVQDEPGEGSESEVEPPLLDDVSVELLEEEGPEEEDSSVSGESADDAEVPEDVVEPGTDDAELGAEGSESDVGSEDVDGLDLALDLDLPDELSSILTRRACLESLLLPSSSEASTHTL